MRLTLRTLLAYLDRVLPADQLTDLKSRVESNENSSKIIERLQEVLKESRLSAPKVDGKGFDGDPNIVAAYLDGSLPSDQIADFEKLCLESDRHLAEVSGVHRILADIIELERNEPSSDRSEIVAATAEFLTPELRAKMTALPGEDLTRSRFAPGTKTRPSANGVAERVVAKAATSSSEHPSPPGKDSELAAPPVVGAGGDHDAHAAAPPPVPKRKLEVPEYMREKSRPMWPLALAGAVFLVALVGATWVAINRPFNTEVAQNNNVDDGVQVEKANTDKVAKETATKANADKIDKGTSKKKTGSSIIEPGFESETNSSTEEEASKSEVESTERITSEVDTAEEMPADVGTEKTVVEPDAIAKKTASSDVEAVATEKVPTDDPVVTTVPEEASEATPEPAKISPASMLDLGRLAPGAEVLIRFDAKKGEWLRAAPRSVLYTGENFIVPPFFQPQLTFRSGVQATVVGPAAVSAKLASKDIVSVDIDDGRVLLLGTGMESQVVPVTTGSVAGEVILVDAGSDAAIEVRKYLPPGSDPLAEPDPRVTVVTIFAIHGPVVWQEQGGEPVTIAPSHVRVIIRGTTLNDELTKGPHASPEWIEGNRLSTLDKITANAIEPQLKSDRALPLALKELPPRRSEVQAFAGRTLALLGDYEDILTALSHDVLRQAYWKQDVETLRAEVARNPERAAAVKSALDRFCSGRSELLFRFLCGYSPEQLVEGGAEELVGSLESSDRDVRAFAIVNLQSITGNLANYNPSESVERNRAAISTWKKFLKDGKVAYRSPPTPMPEFRPLAKADE
jgi:hypothetical protein